MKIGKTISQLATEVARQASSKKDYLADTRRLAFKLDSDDKVVLEGVNGGMRLRPVAHQQMGSVLGIPKNYYDRMLVEAPDLLVKNVNVWLAKQPAKKLVRTLDGEVRAILSDSYRPLDNMDLAEAVLPKLHKLEAEVVSGDVTEARFYLKAVTPKIQAVLDKIQPGNHTIVGQKGDIIQAGVVISNSEVGQGSLRVEAMTYRLVCLNGAIHESAIRKAHLGRGSRGQDAIEDAREFFRTETRIADDRAFFLKVQDTVGAMFDQTRFNARILQYQETQARPIVADVVEVVEVTAKRLQLNEQERGSVLQHLIRGGDLSQFGLANAVTRAAQDDAVTYDRSYEMEKLGAGIIELPASEWKVLAN